MPIKLALVEAPMPRRGRAADVDIQLMQQMNELIGKAKIGTPLSTGETFATKKDADKVAAKLARQLGNFRDDPKSRVASRSFVAKKDPAEWNPDSDQWQFGLYLASPSKPRAKK